MPTLPYRVLDVFTNRPLAGNALGLFPAAAGLDSATMQSIARELNLSETLFITGRPVGPQSYEVRIFTPTAELPFAGHPSIGCAWHLFHEGADKAATLDLYMAGGIVRTELDSAYDPALVSIEPPAVTFGEVLDEPELVARLYGLEVADLALEIGPPQCVSVGMRFLQTPLRSRAALERCRPNVELLERMDRERGFNHLSAFTLEPYTDGATAAVRLFAPLVGVYEDPATGSNAACLAAYLRKHGVLADNADGWARLDHGYSLDRHSALYVRATRSAAGGTDVRVGGQCVEVMRGELSL